MECLFCKIINKEIPSQIVYEDNDILAFNDIAPKAPTHVLVIPKKHIESHAQLLEEDADLMGKIHMVINKIAKERGILDNGYRVVINCGEDGGQEVKHLHFHLLGGKKLEINM